MITVELAGGRGNQMFQYACGRALSLRLGTDLQLNTTNPDRDRLRRYALGCFPNITAPLTKRLPGRIIEEKRPGYQPELLHGIGPDEDVSLRGYWQTEKYFANLADVIRKDFTYGGRVLDPRTQAACSAITTSNATAIHIRRGDYVTDPRSVQIMGNLPMEWYWEALKVMNTEVRRYFVFSDDPEWCEHTFDGFFTKVKGFKDFEDLWLMSLCNHHIVANSSFSWWGAWLSGNSGLNIAPKKWFAQWNSADVCPPSWLRI